MSKIFESPDGGNTIRTREIRATFDIEPRLFGMTKHDLWKMCELAKDNETLRSALEHAIMWYRLTKDENTTNSAEELADEYARLIAEEMDKEMFESIVNEQQKQKCINE